MQRRPPPQQSVQAPPVVYEDQAWPDSGRVKDVTSNELLDKAVLVPLQRPSRPLTLNVDGMRVEVPQASLIGFHGSNHNPVMNLEPLIPQVLQHALTKPARIRR